MAVNNIEVELESDNLDTSQFWKSRDESTQLSMNEELLNIARSGPPEQFISILERECISSSDGIYSIDLDIVDSNGWSPLIHASFNGHLVIVENIISYQEKKYAKEYGDELIEIKENEDKELKWRYLFKQFLCRKVKWNGSTAFHLACARGYELIVKLFINKMVYEYYLPSSESINCTDYDAATPLHCAVLGKHYNICKLLLINGSMITKCDIRGKTPLDWAKERDLTQYINLLKQYQDHQEIQQSKLLENIWKDQEKNEENKSKEASIEIDSNSINNECESISEQTFNNNNHQNYVISPQYTSRFDDDDQNDNTLSQQSQFAFNQNNNNNNNNNNNYYHHHHNKTNNSYSPSYNHPNNEWYNFNHHNNYNQYNNHNHYQYRQMAPRHLRYNNYCNNNRYKSSQTPLPIIPSNPPQLTSSKSCPTNNNIQQFQQSQAEIIEVITIPSKIQKAQKVEEENNNNNNCDDNKLEEISDINNLSKKATPKIREKIIAAQTPTDDDNDNDGDPAMDDNKNDKENDNKCSNDDDPAMDAIRFQNKYLIARCVSLEKEHKEITTECKQQLFKENNRWRLREENLLKQLENKQKQIHELRHTLRRMRRFLDNLPVKIKRDFYCDNNNFNQFEQTQYEIQQIQNRSEGNYTMREIQKNKNNKNGWKTTENNNNDNNNNINNNNDNYDDDGNNNNNNNDHIKCQENEKQQQQKQENQEKKQEENTNNNNNNNNNNDNLMDNDKGTRFMNRGRNRNNKRNRNRHNNNDQNKDKFIFSNAQRSRKSAMSDKSWRRKK